MKINKRHPIFMMGICLFFAACTTNSIKKTTSASPTPSAQKTDISIFDPGPDGTPLPPQNKAVGEKWPPEVKKFIDGMLELFGKYERPSLSNEEIEKTLGLKLTKKSYFPWEGVDAVYDISDSDFLWKERYSDAAEYRIGSIKKDGNRFLAFHFPIEASRYCINPYNFSIYTGNKYAPEMPVHGFIPPDKLWPLAYEWGMFKRNSDGRFLPGKGPFIALITSNDCILKFTARTYITEEMKP